MPDKWELATKKLFDLTESGKLSWRREDGFHSERLCGLAYSAEVNGKKIVTYWEKVHGYNHPDDVRPVIEFVTTSPDDHSTVPEWRWPLTDYHYRLVDSVKFHAADGEKFLDAFLSSVS